MRRYADINPENIDLELGGAPQDHVQLAVIEGKPDRFSANFAGSLKEIGRAHV